VRTNPGAASKKVSKPSSKSASSSAATGSGRNKRKAEVDVVSTESKPAPTPTATTPTSGRQAHSQLTLDGTEYLNQEGFGKLQNDRRSLLTELNQKPFDRLPSGEEAMRAFIKALRACGAKADKLHKETVVLHIKIKKHATARVPEESLDVLAQFRDDCLRLSQLCILFLARDLDTCKKKEMLEAMHAASESIPHAMQALNYQALGHELFRLGKHTELIDHFSGKSDASSALTLTLQDQLSTNMQILEDRFGQAKEVQG